MILSKMWCTRHRPSCDFTSSAKTRRRSPRSRSLRAEAPPTRRMERTPRPRFARDWPSLSHSSSSSSSLPPAAPVEAASSSSSASSPRGRLCATTVRSGAAPSLSVTVGCPAMVVVVFAVASTTAFSFSSSPPCRPQANLAAAPTPYKPAPPNAVAWPLAGDVGAAEGAWGPASENAAAMPMLEKAVPNAPVRGGEGITTASLSTTGEESDALSESESVETASAYAAAEEPAKPGP
mmetsp:Transcript_100235/g.278957  ORF Transcript_100235/g.278957 Transcript_100235/m.278957 type:complete len:236 (+) Transcript_100235:1372-2079(+)